MTLVPQHILSSESELSESDDDSARFKSCKGFLSLRNFGVALFV